MSSFQFVYSGSDTRKITRLNNDPVIISGDSNSTTFSFKFPESHKEYKKTIEWDFWIKDPEGNLINPSYPIVNDEHIIPGEVTYLNSAKLVGFSLIFERDNDPLFQERSTIYPIYISKGVKITKNVSIFDTLMQEVYITSAKVEEHTSDVDNPHSVTKAQVGLGNSDNTSDINKPISTATQTALNAKQDKLTFDSAPVQDSDNIVRSGGIYDALQAIEVGDLTLDDTPVQGSDNPVKSSGIYDALNAKADKSELALKADKTELALKADITYVDAEIAGIDVAPPIATDAEAIEGTDDTKMMTPLKVKTVTSGVRDYTDDEIGRLEHVISMATNNAGEILNLKADKTEVNDGLALKADKTELPLFATEAEAIAGTNNSTLMSPLRVEQAFNEKFKVIDGVLNVSENGEWVKYEPK